MLPSIVRDHGVGISSSASLTFRQNPHADRAYARKPPLPLPRQRHQHLEAHSACGDARSAATATPPTSPAVPATVGTVACRTLDSDRWVVGHAIQHTAVPVLPP
jgi:hypothetical protein